MMLSQERLKSLMNYEPETGVFTWLMKPCRNVRVGEVAGSLNKGTGYVRVIVDRKRYLAHRLAWLYIYGDLPPDQLDHINRIKTDNRIGNLRLANNAENHQNMPMPRNNTSGHIGVCWKKKSQKWEARITINKKQIHLGSFTDLSEAIAARKAAEVNFHTFQHNQEN